MISTDRSTPDRIPGLGAVVLCGGSSSRMGVDKSRLMLGQQSFLECIVERVSEVAFPIVVVGAPSSDQRKQMIDVVVAHDENQDCGPLEGIRVGLQQLKHDVAFAFVTACDAPLLKSALIAHLSQLIGDHQAVVPVSGSRTFGMTAIYRTDVVDVIENLIQSKRLRVKDLAANLDTVLVDVESFRFIDPHLDSLMNVNTQEDYHKLLGRLTD